MGKVDLLSTSRGNSPFTGPLLFCCYKLKGYSTKRAAPSLVANKYSMLPEDSQALLPSVRNDDYFNMSNRFSATPQKRWTGMHVPYPPHKSAQE